ncbi:MAG: hypothetical protein RI885_2179 [Actinomycetota bacterium]|jgi:hypothetical protein
MISTELARALQDSGLAWTPASGDVFRIDRAEVDGDVFTVSDMTVEAHEYPSGTILGFNGTTEWALDSVDLDDALWMPREDQLREALGAAFRSLTLESGVFGVTADIRGSLETFGGDDAADAYGRALLASIDTSSFIAVEDADVTEA